MKRKLIRPTVLKTLKSNVVMYIFVYGEGGLNIENHTWMNHKEDLFLLRKVLPVNTSRLETYNTLHIHVIEVGSWSGTSTHTHTH